MARHTLSLTLRSDGAYSATQLLAFARGPLVDDFRDSAPAITPRMFESSGSRAMIALDWSFDRKGTLPHAFIEDFLGQSFADAGISLDFHASPHACAA